MAYNFPQRNRIISGIKQWGNCYRSIKQSGSLITVDYALNQSKDVMVVPGPDF